MRFLVDGFEHLDYVSSQIPESIRETAEKNKNNLLAATGMVSGSKESGDAQDRGIAALRMELQGIATDRLLLEVNTKFDLKGQGLWGASKKTPFRGVVANKGGDSTGKNTAKLDEDYIDIPDFIPGYLRGDIIGFKETSQMTSGKKSQRSGSLYVRPTTSGVMVILNIKL